MALSRSRLEDMLAVFRLEMDKAAADKIKAEKAYNYWKDACDRTVEELNDIQERGE